MLLEEIKNEQKITDYIFSITLLLGSFSFLIVGISSYINFNIIKFLNASEIIFFPQGLVMSIYGSLGILISISQLLILYWNIGEGYNEFNNEKGIVKIFRNGYPGKNKKIEINLEIKDILW